MTYVPIVPHVPASESSDTDRRDLITALKLLSGEDCIRDARQAQTILVSLTESRHDDVADDALAIMQTGLKQGWFEENPPNYYILRGIAERSIEKYEKGSNTRQQRMIMALVGGLAAFLGLAVLLFFRQSGGESPPWIMIALVGGLLVVGLLGFLMKKNT